MEKEHKVAKRILAGFEILSGMVTLICGIFPGAIQHFFPSSQQDANIIIFKTSIFLTSVFGIVLIISLYNDLIILLNNIKDKTEGLDTLGNSLSDLQKVNEIACTVESIKENLNSDIIDYVLIGDNPIWYFVLICKFENCPCKEFELTIACKDNQLLKFESCIWNDKKFNLVNLAKEAINTRVEGSPLNKVDFCINKGLSLSALTISINKGKSLTYDMPIYITLKEKGTNTILLDKTEYLFYGSSQ